MKKLMLIIATALLAVACSPDEISKIEPDEVETPGNNEPGKPKPSEENYFNDNYYYKLYKDGLFEIVNTQTGEKKQLRIDEAERMLRLYFGVWLYDKKAPYIFSFDNGLSIDIQGLRGGKYE